MKLNAAWLGYGIYAGGAESNALHIAHYFHKKCSRLDFILFNDIHEYSEQHKKIYESLRFYYIFKNKYKKIPKLLYPIYAIFVVYRLVKLVKKNNYNVLLSMVEYYPSLLTVFVGKLLHIKTIMIVGDNPTEDLKRRSILNRLLYFLLLKISLLLSDLVVCGSQGLADHMIDKYQCKKSKTITIYNGIDINQIQSSKCKNLKLRRYKSIVILGRLVDKKNHLLLIDCLALVLKKIKIKAFIIGKGENEQKLKERVLKNNLQNTIFFKGFISKDPFLHLKKSDLFVFTSQYEGFGNVILEAMACGLPIISMNCFYGPQEILSGKTKYDSTSDNIANKQIVKEKYGVLVNYSSIYKQNVLSLSKAIFLLLKNNQLHYHYKKMSLKRIKEFSYKKMSRQYYDMASILIKN